MDEGGLGPVAGEFRGRDARDRDVRRPVVGEAVIARVSTLDLPLAVWRRLLVDAGRRLGVAVSAVLIDDDDAATQFVLVVVTQGQHESPDPASSHRDGPG